MVRAVRRRPGAPLLAVHRAEIAVARPPTRPRCVTPLSLQIFDVGVAGEEPEQLMHDRLQRQPLGGQHRKAGRKVEAHLVAEHRQRAGAGRRSHRLVRRRSATGSVRAGRDTGAGHGVGSRSLCASAANCNGRACPCWPMRALLATHIPTKSEVWTSWRNDKVAELASPPLALSTLKIGRLQLHRLEEPASTWRSRS